MLHLCISHMGQDLENQPRLKEPAEGTRVHHARRLERRAKNHHQGTRKYKSGTQTQVPDHSMLPGKALDAACGLTADIGTKQQERILILHQNASSPFSAAEDKQLV